MTSNEIYNAYKIFEMETAMPLLANSGEDSWWIEKHDNNCENPWHCKLGED